MQLKSKEKIQGAFIDMLPYGPRGSVLRQQRNLSNIALQLENGRDITFTAIEHEGQKHFRLSETRLTIQDGYNTAFIGTISELIDKLKHH